MPKVTIKRDNATIEISDLSFDQVKELAGLNAHAPRTPTRGPRRDRAASLLTAAGLPAVDTVTVMLRGKWPVTLKEPRRFALALQAWG